MDFVFAILPNADMLLEESWSNEMSRLASETPADIRITDPFIRQQVEAERVRAGESTSTKTAARLIVERLAQRELVSRGIPDLPHVPEKTAA